METGLVIAGLIICFVLIFQRWFWLIALGIGSLAACVAMLASIIHLRFIGATGYMIVMIICWTVAKSIADDYPPPKKNGGQEDGLKHYKDSPDWSPH